MNDLRMPELEELAFPLLAIILNWVYLLQAI